MYLVRHMRGTASELGLIDPYTLNAKSDLRVGFSSVI